MNYLGSMNCELSGVVSCHCNHVVIPRFLDPDPRDRMMGLESPLGLVYVHGHMPTRYQYSVWSSRLNYLQVSCDSYIVPIYSREYGIIHLGNDAK